MLNYKMSQDPDAIEVHICKKMDEALSKDEMSLLLVLLNAPKQTKNIPEGEMPFLCHAVKKRIEVCFTYTITDQRLLLFLGIIAQNAGNAIMYCWYLQYWAKKNGKREIDLELFCKRIFPYGFPSMEDMLKIWYASKVKPGGERRNDSNLVDHSSAGLNLQFVKEAVS